MNSEELTNKLNEIEQQKKSLVSQMDTLYKAIQDAMPSEAATWMDKEVERRITDNPEHVQSMGMNSLKALKSKLETLKGKLVELVASEFENSKRWPHHAEIKEGNKPSPDEQRIEPHPNEAFRNVISNLGAILDEFGLLKESVGHISSWKKMGVGKFRYAINPGYGMNADAILKDYFRMLQDYVSVNKHIQSIQRQISEAKATELWKKA